MHKFGDHDESLFKLITKLCITILRNGDDDAAPIAVRKCCAKSYEVLLKQYPLSQTELNSTNYDEFHSELQRQLLTTLFDARCSQNMQRRYEALLKCKEQVEAEQQFFDTSLGTSFLYLLLKLSQLYEVTATNAHPHALLIPAAFKLSNHLENNQYRMDSRKLQCIVHPCPKYFKGVDRIQASEHNNKKMVCHKFPRPLQFPSSFSLETFETKKIEGRLSGLMPNRCAHMSYRKERITTYRCVIKKPKGPAKMAQPKKPRETFRRLRSFVTDMNVSYELMTLLAAEKNEIFKPLVMSLETFVRDLKALVVGTRSETFYLDEDDVFQMTENVSVEDVLPDEIRKYVEPFLNCGTCFRHLNNMSNHLELEHRQDGFLYKNMCRAVAQYLLGFRQFVCTQTQLSLSSLYRNLRSMMEQLVELTMTLKIDPEVDHLQRSRSSYFLIYIWQQMQECTKNDFITLLMFILKQMCYVYYKRLQKWAMRGILDDPCKELFISYVEHYPEKTKNFFDRAYFIDTTSVPGFLRSCEQSILDCGKYTMLLKNFRPNHPLFNLNSPEIRLCFNQHDLQLLTNDCKAYLISGRAFSKPICMNDIFTARQLQKEKCQVYGQRSRNEQIEIWEMQQRLAHQNVLEKKKLLLEEFKQQKEQHIKCMVDKRTEIIAEELRCQQELEKFESQKLTNESVNLRKRIDSLEVHSRLLREKSFDADREIQRKLKWEIGHTVPVESTSSNSLKRSESESIKTNRNAAEQAQITTVKRSASDLANSNDSTSSEQLSEFEQNRQHMLRSTGFEYATNVLVELNDNTLDAKGTINNTGKPLKEAQTNKLRVMTSHTDVFPQPTMTADVNLNVLLEEKPLTDLQRNRSKMMFKDLFEEFNNPEDMHSERARRHLDLDSELARNRHRVLCSEYELAPLTQNAKQSQEDDASHDSELSRNRQRVLGSVLDTVRLVKFVKQHNKEEIVIDANGCAPELSLDLIELLSFVDTSEINTPMSTTSDVSASSVFEECQAETAALDACNNNANNNSSSIDNDSTSEYLDAVCELNSPKKFDKMDDHINGIVRKPKKSTAVAEQNNVNSLDQTLQTFDQLFDAMNKDLRCPKFNSSLRPDDKANMKAAYVNHHSTIMIKHFLQNSIMRPLQSHFYLVRNEVMRIFFEDLCIYEHFRTLRNYFFLMDGEFSEFITDGIIGQLESGKPLEKVLDYQSLHDVLNKAIASSLAGASKYSENLSFIVKDNRYETRLTSPDLLNGLSLCYTVEWPLNLILNSEVQDRYKMIFQYLFKLRRVSYALERVYKHLQEPLRQPNSQKLLMSPQYRHVQLMRHKLAHFVNTLHNYLASSVLQSSWMKLKNALRSVKTVESLYQTHVLYLKGITFLCLLNRKSEKIREAIYDIFTISLRFSQVVTSAQFYYDELTQQFVHDRYSRLLYEEYQFDKFLNYTIYLGQKVVRHGYQEEIRHFIELVNINGYYQEKSMYSHVSYP